MHILIVEDQESTASFLTEGLMDSGHRVTQAPTIGAAVSAIVDTTYDLLLVDRNLPDGDGLNWLSNLRARGLTVPAICISARDTVNDRVDGLQRGADDYLIKPFAFDELLARILAVTRRTGRSSSDNTLEVGELLIDLVGLRVTRAGEPIDLTAQEFRLLRYMAENAGRVLSRAQLLHGVWGLRHDPGTNVVDVYVSYLRKKIDRGRPTALVHTVRGMGYIVEDRS